MNICLFIYFHLIQIFLFLFDFNINLVLPIYLKHTKSSFSLLFKYLSYLNGSQHSIILLSTCIYSESCTHHGILILLTYFTYLLTYLTTSSQVARGLEKMLEPKKLDRNSPTSLPADSLRCDYESGFRNA